MLFSIDYASTTSTPLALERGGSFQCKDTERNFLHLFHPLCNITIPGEKAWQVGDCILARWIKHVNIFVTRFILHMN
jgi:hypothetical protein